MKRGEVHFLTSLCSPSPYAPALCPPLPVHPYASALLTWPPFPSPYPPAQVEWFYFTSYLKHWSQPKFSDALACVPQVW